MKKRFAAWETIASLTLLGLVLTSRSQAANHPAVTGQNANCNSCHADMTIGKSVHSQGEIACSICHSVRPEGNMAEVELTVPRAQLCFVCHERTAMEQHVSATAKKECLDCHDAHRSARSMLLRRDVDTDYALSNPSPARPKRPTSQGAGARTHTAGKRGTSPRAQATDHNM